MKQDRRNVLTSGMMALAAGANAGTPALPPPGFLNVRDFGARGDSSADDAPAIQNAIDKASLTNRGGIYFPAAEPHRHYVIKRTLIVRRPISMVGAGPNAATLFAIGFKPNQFIIDFDCEPIDVVQHVLLTGFTLRSDDRRASGVRLKNVAYVLFKHFVIRGVLDGVSITGAGTYSVSFEQFTGYDTARHTVHMDGASGGFYSFVASTFTGTAGVFIDEKSSVNGVGFVNCNFEQCGVASFHAAGEVLGLSFSGCRTEGSNGDDFLIAPVAGRKVAGLSINGCHFSSDNGKARPVVLGGAGGRIGGFNICGNFVGYAGDVFVELDKTCTSGMVAGNFLSRASMKGTNREMAGIQAFANGS